MKTAFVKIIVTVLICFMIIPTSIGVAFADSDIYSNVLDDLQKDKTFNFDDYPINQLDYSLTLIQVAESVNNELFVYVYQPSSGIHNIKATRIRIALGSETPQDYTLTYLNSNGVFFKYKVDNFTVNPLLEIREYYVVCIFRKSNADIGDKVTDENNNIITELSYDVSKKYKAMTNLDGTVSYNQSGFETITITDKYVGQLRYEDGFTWKDIISIDSDCYSHFIAFKANRTIDKLLKAEVKYQKMYCSYTTSSGLAKEYAGDDTVSLTYDSKGVYDDGGLFSNTHEWKRIEPVTDFIKSETFDKAFSSSAITEEAKKEIENKDWVLRFTETYREDVGGLVTTSTWYEISNVTLMELTFETDGKIYRLGCVDNYQSGDGEPDNKEEHGVNADFWKKRWAELEEWIKALLAVLGLIGFGIILILFWPFIKIIGSLIWSALRFIWRILTAPFKWLFGGRKR